MALLRRRGEGRRTARAALVLVAVAATSPWMAQPAAASPGNCRFIPVTLNDVPIASFGRCDTGTGQYAALVYCNNYAYHVTGSWYSPGSGDNSYAYCHTNWLGWYDRADFVGYTYRG